VAPKSTSPRPRADVVDLLRWHRLSKFLPAKRTGTSSRGDVAGGVGGHIARRRRALISRFSGEVDRIVSAMLSMPSCTRQNGCSIEAVFITRAWVAKGNRSRRHSTSAFQSDRSCPPGGLASGVRVKVREQQTRPRSRVRRLAEGAYPRLWVEFRQGLVDHER